MNPKEKSQEKTPCWECGNDIVQYFEKKYSGLRGKCLVCEIDFPLE